MIMKKILIIGASSGIGKSLFQRLSASVDVLGTFHTHLPAETSGGKWHALDVREEAPDMSFIPEALDGLVYCPGSINLKPFGRIPAKAFLEDYQLQVLGAIKCIQAALPSFNEGAGIVLFSTVAVQRGYPYHAQVAANKGAIEGLTRALAAELAPKVRVNCIAPSLTDTPLASRLLSTPEKAASHAKRHPLQRIGKAEDAAAMAEFLLSEQASWITGQIIGVDGGISAL